MEILCILIIFPILRSIPPSYIDNTIDLTLVYSPSAQMQVMSWVDISYAVHEAFALKGCRLEPGQCFFGSFGALHFI